MKIFEATQENLREMQGQNVRMNDDECILVVKLVAITPKTLADSNDIESVVNAHPGYIFVGMMDEIQQSIHDSFRAMANEYSKSVKEFNHERFQEDGPKESESSTAATGD